MWPIISRDSVGNRVTTLQFLLRGRGFEVAADGIFGPKTEGAVRQLQSQSGLPSNGTVDNETWLAVITQVGPGSSGDAVRAAQNMLPPLAVDGAFGPATKSRVRDFQQRLGLVADGIVGPKTWFWVVSFGGLPTVAPAQVIIEPDSVGGIGLGALGSEVVAVLGQPTAHGNHTDVHGAQYDFRHWQLSGERGLTLNFRTPSATSPRLTDWSANAPGPATALGVQVGDPAATVVAAYGPLGPFIGGSSVGSVQGGENRMIVVVDDGTQVVSVIIGGDPTFWMRSIAT
ncbi:MAG: peptidoglycan-binding protein [Acidimicrobiales bacterium]